MSDLIERDAAKACLPMHWFHAPVYHNSAIAALNALPTIDPAQIRADALREALTLGAKVLREIAGMSLIGASDTAWSAARRIEAVLADTAPQSTELDDKIVLDAVAKRDGFGRPIEPADPHRAIGEASHEA